MVALQFHLEVTRKGAERLISNCRKEIVEAPFIQSSEEILSMDDRFIKANEKMERLLDVLSTVGID